jgi:SAM-dependent methyltransferase
VASEPLGSGRRLLAGVRVLLSEDIVTAGMDYFDYQIRVARDVVLPWLSARMPVEDKHVADFGCHEGGMLEGLRFGGVADALGIELNANVVERSRFVPDERFRIEIGNLTERDPAEGAFDIVLLHDVLEHVVDCNTVLAAARRSLAPGGRVFVSFPPYWSAYGGHQHLAAGRARAVPYVHYLPEGMFFRVARPADNEYMASADSLEDMVSVRSTRLSLRKAERAFSSSGLGVVSSEFFLVRPEHTLRYGVRTMSAGTLGRMPGMRELIVSGAFYLLAADD